MKKVLKWICVVLFALTAIYSGVAAFFLQGIGAYKLNNTIGTILSRSWQYTAVAAFVLMLVIVIPSVKKVAASRGKKIPTATQENTGIEQTQPETKKHASARKPKKEKKTAAGKIPPAQPEKIASAQPEKIAPAASVDVPGAVVSDTVDLPDIPMAAAPAETMPMSLLEDMATLPMPMEDEIMAVPQFSACEPVQMPAVEPADVPDMPCAVSIQAQVDDSSTMLMPMEDDTLPMPGDLPAQSHTMLMPEDIDLPDEVPVTVQPVGRFCTNCGAAVKETAKFCGKCGTRLGGDGV